ncbi:ABC transporter ATP-binding protein uup, partial [Haemophilus influenzae]
NEN